MANNENKTSEMQKSESGMELYYRFLDWHVDRIRQIPFPGNPFDYMEFPIAWDRSRPLIEHLHYIFKAYIKELKDFGDIPQNIQQDCKEICESILNAMSKAMHYQKGNACDELDNIDNILRFEVYRRALKGEDTLYRMRAGKVENMESEFYHAPFDQLYYSKSYRFSVTGHPCLYLGYSKEVCIAETGTEQGLIAEFRVKEGEAFDHIIDLTLKSMKDSSEMFRIWPVLAACYVAPPRLEKEGFKEEYIFPQLLTEYIMTYLKAEGLMYYSCRNKKLNPKDKTYINMVLFSQLQESGYRDFCNLDRIPRLTQRYDETLMGKLKITNIHNV